MSADTQVEPRDEILLAAAARGDFDAFHAFYERWSGRVFAFARRLSRDASLAEDLTQEVFAAVWTKAGTFQPDRGGAAAWLFTLTRNKLVDHWRRSGGNAGSRTLDDPASPREDHDLRLLLRQVLACVAPEQRQAIEMAFFGGLTYEEAAGRLAVPVGTLKSRIRLGLRTMRAALA
ncbi:MAG TPA: sigma-70 family RNA polymerase sigma factor [Thermoanaerobaculia bacterium]|jgi:RNA polymerase sigma-70 factor (ECF subfamily)|nr:sigma-70 family RNA polymerase sigma factor [Thermoanaerobaculia bacterium]